MEKSFPTQAVALNYDQENAPKVIAKGEDTIAQEIMTIAKAHGIPFYQDPELTRLLSNIPLGEEIPKNLYITVAKIIAFAYVLNGKHPNHLP